MTSDCCFLIQDLFVALKQIPSKIAHNILRYFRNYILSNKLNKYLQQRNTIITEATLKKSRSGLFDSIRFFPEAYQEHLLRILDGMRMGVLGPNFRFEGGSYSYKY